MKYSRRGLHRTNGRSAGHHTYAPMVLLDKDKPCYICLTSLLLAGKTIAETETECATNPKAQFAFDGASPEIMLSRFPLSDTASYILPSTAYRRAILGAKMNIGSEESPEVVDVFCSQLSYPQGSTFPYTGPYGSATTVEGIEKPLEGWESEQYLQAQRAIGWIRSRADSGQLAVIAGDLASGDADAPGLSELNPATVRLFRKAFTEAIPSDYAPACDLCAYPENAYGGSNQYWLAHIFTFGRRVGVLSAQTTLTDKTVTLPKDSLP